MNIFGSNPMNMKYRFFALLLLMVTLFSACKEETDHSAQKEQLQAEIFKKFPATESISIQIGRSTDFTVVLGNKQLYKVSDAKKQQVANELGLMTIRIFGKDNGFSDAKLVLTNDGRNESFTPADGITMPINIDSLNNAVQP